MKAKQLLKLRNFNHVKSTSYLCFISLENLLQMRIDIFKHFRHLVPKLSDFQLLLQ
jgi:hypothetical protein